MDQKHAIGALGALAQETRLALFRLLVTCGPEGLPAGVIAERLGVPVVAFLSFAAARARRADHPAAPQPAADLFGRIRRDERVVGLPHRKLLRAWGVMRPGLQSSRRLYERRER